MHLIILERKDWPKTITLLPPPTAFKFDPAIHVPKSTCIAETSIIKQNNNKQTKNKILYIFKTLFYNHITIFLIINLTTKNL